MEKQLNIMLKPTNSTDVIPVHFKDTDTVRNPIHSAGISVPENSRLVCVAKGSQLQLDLSLAVQGIQPNDTIFVLYQKNKLSNDGFDGRNFNLILREKIRNRMKEFERQQKELFNEALRVSDLSFLLFDYYKTSTNDYKTILSQSEEKHDDELKQVTMIDPEKPKDISDQPLPTCWPNDSEQNMNENLVFDNQCKENIFDE